LPNEKEEEDEEEEEEEEENVGKEGEETENKEKKKENAPQQKKDPLGALNQLTERTDEASTEFLTAICYHHYHGRLDDGAFDASKQRAAGNEFVVGILTFFILGKFFRPIKVKLLENQGSVCTIKGVIDILATIEHPRALNVLLQLLPRCM
jgi:hypothetical protein